MNEAEQIDLSFKIVELVHGKTCSLAEAIGILEVCKLTLFSQANEGYIPPNDKETDLG